MRVFWLDWDSPCSLLRAKALAEGQKRKMPSWMDLAGKSARSSWIYMEMEPRQRSCGISPTSEKCPEFRPSENVSEMVEDAADINILKADTSESSEIVFNNTNYQEPVHEGDEEEEEEEEEDNQNISFQSSFRLGLTASLDTSTIEIKWSPDISRDHHISNLEFVNGRTTAVGDTEEEQQDTEADYEEIGDLHELGDTDEHQYAILSNDNFVLQKDERHAAKGFINVVHTSHAPEHHDKICRARTICVSRHGTTAKTVDAAVRNRAFSPFGAGHVQSTSASPTDPSLTIRASLSPSVTCPREGKPTKAACNCI